MRIDERRGIKTTSSTSKLNDLVHLAIGHEEQFQRANTFDLPRKVSNESQYSDREDESVIGPSSSFRSISAITTSTGTRETSDVGKYDTPSSESNTIQSLGYSLYKYKNPYSLSVNNRSYFEKSSNSMQENIFEDEPQEGRAKQSILLSCREYLANYQESCGTPRTEYSYAALIIVMAQATARSLWALIYIFVNVAPVIQMFSFILRFVLDKVINIRRTKDIQQIIIKSMILIVQLLSVYICLMFILGFIILPIVQMAIGIATKFTMRN